MVNTRKAGVLRRLNVALLKTRKDTFKSKFRNDFAS